jgi:hypothetical protein
LLFLSCYGTASIWFIIMRLLPVSLKDMTRRMFLIFNWILSRLCKMILY